MWKHRSKEEMERNAVGLKRRNVSRRKWLKEGVERLVREAEEREERERERESGGGEGQVVVEQQQVQGEAAGVEKTKIEAVSPPVEPPRATKENTPTASSQAAVVPASAPSS